METIENIIKEMRDAGGYEFEYFADRIEQAVTNCNQLKMREALLKSRKAMDEMSKSIFQGWIEDGLAEVMGEAQRDISSALSTPPRNCDRFEDYGDAIRAFGGEGYDYETIEDWLFAEVKGLAK